MGSVRKRPAGAWEARWYGPDGRQHSVNFTTKGDATRHIRAMEGAKVRGDYVDQSLSRTPFSKVAEEWLETTRLLKPKTRDGYERIVHHHLIPEFGLTPVARINAAIIERFITRLDVSPGTARNVLRVLSPIMQYAVKGGMIARNPVADVTRPRSVKRGPEELQALSADQVRQLAEAVGPTSSTLVYFAAYTGLRAGEIAALQVKHVNLKNASVRVLGSFSTVNGKLEYGTPKNGRTRRVTMPSFLVRMVEEQVGGRAAGEYLFGGETPMRHANWYQRTYRPAVRRLVADGTWPEELAAFRFHDLRHTAASLAIHLGAHPKVIQERLGHSSITITLDRYGHLYEGHDEELLTKLDDLFEENAAVELPRRAAS